VPPVKVEYVRDNSCEYIYIWSTIQNEVHYTTWLLIAAAYTSAQEAADKQAWSLLPVRASVLHAGSLATRCDDGQHNLHTCVCPLKRVGGKRACTLVAGTLDIASEVRQFLKKIFGLSHLPPAEVCDCFALEFLYNLSNDKRREQFCDYLLENYIDAVSTYPLLFGPKVLHHHWGP